MSHSAALSSVPPAVTANARQGDRDDGSPLIRRIAGVVTLSDTEKSVLQKVEVYGRALPAQTPLHSRNGADLPQILLAGWACYRRMLKDGRRQIVRFLLPGDMIGSPLRFDGPPDVEAFSLTPVSVADARPLQVMLAKPGHDLPRIVDAFVLLERAEQSGLVDQIVRLGRQSVYERLLHLMLELHGRLEAVGQARGSTFKAPITQEMLADALGLSIVHVNRVLQQIRHDRLLVMQRGKVTLLEPELMRERSEWSARPTPEALAVWSAHKPDSILTSRPIEDTPVGGIGSIQLIG